MKIPTEILCDIFTKAIQPPQDSWGGGSLTNYTSHIDSKEVSLAPCHFLPQLRRHHPLSTCVKSDPTSRAAIRCVCRYWKETIDGNPKFWTFVILTGRELLSYVQKYLDMSKPLPLSLHLDLALGPNHSNNRSPYHEETPSISLKRYERLLDLCLESRKRLTTCQITLRCSMQTIAVVGRLASLLSCPTLHIFHVHQLLQCEVPGMLSIPAFPLHYPAPTLRHLTLTYIPVIMHTPPSTVLHVTSLDIHFRYITDDIGRSWNNFGYLLFRATSLKTLRVTFATNPVMGLSVIPLSLPNLQEICITVTQNRNIGTILPLFAKSNATSLSVSNRAICTFDSASNTAFRDLFIPGMSITAGYMIARLTIFAVSWGAVDDYTITMLAQHLTAVRHLFIQNVSDNSKGPYHLLAFLLNNSIEAEMKKKNEPAIQTTLYCPELRFLEIKKRNQYDRSGDYLVQSRKRLGLPILQYVIRT